MEKLNLFEHLDIIDPLFQELEAIKKGETQLIGELTVHFSERGLYEVSKEGEFHECGGSDLKNVYDFIVEI